MSGATPALHLRGVLLPQDELVDLWVADGVVHDRPVPGAVTVTPADSRSRPVGWIVPGLVDLPGTRACC